MSDAPDDTRIDWSVTSFDGARREQLRRWSRLSLREIVAALEEMQDLAERLGQAGPGAEPGAQGRPGPRPDDGPR